jgi:hypothetical protein
LIWLFAQEKLCPFLCPPRLKFNSAEIINRPAFRFYADMAVSFHHGAGYMPRQYHDSLIISPVVAPPSVGSRHAVFILDMTSPSRL